MLIQQHVFITTRCDECLPIANSHIVMDTYNKLKTSLKCVLYVKGLFIIYNITFRINLPNMQCYKSHYALSVICCGSVQDDIVSMNF